jgi:uncharacterized protein (TIGR03437 family)
LVSFAGQLGLWTRLTPGVDEPGLFHVTNAAGTQLTTRVVPGEYISLFGPSIGAPGAEVFLGNTPATVIYAGANQINALTPLSLEAPGETTIRVRRGGVDLPVYPLATAVAAPEIFRTAAGSAVLHADGTWNSEANLAHAGDVVSIWLTGASSPVCCSVKVGTTDAAVLYAGLAPGYAAGLWQVNFQLPARVYPNDVVSVTSAGATSSYVVVFTR